MQDWGLHAYMMRYFTIKLDFRKPYEYYISSSTCQDTLIKNFTKVSTDTRKYELYKRKN